MKSLMRKKKYLGVLVIPIILLLVGCAAKGEKEPISPQATPENLIKDIKVVQKDEGKRVIIEGGAPLIYTFFRLVPEPLQLVVDIPETGLVKEISSPIRVDDEMIQEIIATQQERKTEISIYLKSLVKYQVQKEGNLLYVDFGEKIPVFAKEVEKKGEKEIEIVEEIPSPTKEEVPIKELTPAQSLTNVSVDTSHKDRVILHLKADGKLEEYKTVDLKNPTRLVIDLFKVKRKTPQKSFSVDSPYLEKVRLGDHPTKVRVVLDFPATALPPHRIDPLEDELRIELGKEVKADILPAEPEKEVAKKEEVSGKVSTTGQITGIDFKQLADKSRIIISTSVKAPYEAIKGPEDTLLVDVKGMVIPRRFTRHLDTHEFASPVITVTPTNIVVDSQKSARFIVKLRKMVSFDISQVAQKIYIDFEIPEEFKVEKPKPLEVVTVKKAPKVKEATKMPAAEPAERAPTPPVKRSVTEISGPPEEMREKVYTGKKITLDFKDADIDNILRLFAEVSNLNVIATEDVKGKVTIRLIDVPWDQALDIILQANNLGIEKIGNVIRIAPQERLRREKEAKAKAIKAKEELEPLITELIPISYSKAADLIPKVKDLLSARGSVSVDERTNTVIIKDIRDNLDRAKDLVRRLDAQTPQILIQAKIVEANTNFAKELGISWGGQFIDTAHAPDVRQQVGGASSGNYAVDLPAAVGAGAGGALEFIIGNMANTKFLQIKLSALEESGEGKIVSSPRVTTLDHREAYIEQGLRIPFLKITEEGTVTTDFIEANLKLLVTPHVTADGHIKMEIKASKDTPDFSITVQGVPAIDKKEAKTEVLVLDGEVVVIGGIYVTEKTKSSDGVPYFSKIPLFGWLFKKKENEDNKRELLIFIAPRIVQPRKVATT